MFTCRLQQRCVKGLYCTLPQYRVDPGGPTGPGEPLEDGAWQLIVTPTVIKQKLLSSLNFTAYAIPNVAI